MIFFREKADDAPLLFDNDTSSGAKTLSADIMGCVYTSKCCAVGFVYIHSCCLHASGKESMLACTAPRPPTGGGMLSLGAKNHAVPVLLLVILLCKKLLCDIFTLRPFLIQSDSSSRKRPFSTGIFWPFFLSSVESIF